MFAFFLLLNFQVTFAGDSHVRYWCYYTLKHLGILPKNLPEVYHGNFQAGIVDFRWVPLGDDLRRWLLGRLEDLKSSHKKKRSDRGKRHRKGQTLLIMNALAHNMARKTIVDYLKAFLRLTKQLKQMLDDNDNDDDVYDNKNLRLV